MRSSHRMCSVKKGVLRNVFPQDILFPKSTFKGPGKNLGQFFMNKKVCIWTKGKVG